MIVKIRSHKDSLLKLLKQEIFFCFILVIQVQKYKEWLRIVILIMWGWLSNLVII